MAVQLGETERRALSGANGPGAAMAMRILADASALLGAERLTPIVSAHIDGCLYHGDAGVAFAEKLVEGGAQVAVPTTLNVGALDLLRPQTTRLAEHERAMALRLMRAHERLGCRPTWTCAPYQAGHRPGLGEQVAWGESNAIAFVNSVLGARSERYGDYMDLCCAISGHAPYVGLHRPENRVATTVVDASGISEALVGSDVFWPVFGTWYGATLGREIGVVTGLPGTAQPIDEDRLKAFGAAAASSGSVALFHIVGLTPEAPDLDTALGGAEPATTIGLTAEMLRASRDALSTAGNGQLDAVAVGSPHFSLAEFEQLLGLLDSRKASIPVYACTGRHVVAQLEQRGWDQRLREAGVTIVADTCVVVTPILAEIDGVLMTNSGKFAHYTPPNTGYGVVFGSLADCAESAVAGAVRRDERLWS
ncbi:MAG: aconitase X catalytic domain-containing protein [Alphaproteobacteria bacterium]|nr:aconitase X catalytic domain-containing protein [Alphaproteobacteria bacterium]